MDKLTEIETQLSDALLRIDALNPLGSYTFYNTVTEVNNGDEAIATEQGSYPVCNIEQTTLQTVANSSNIATTSVIDFEIHGYVSIGETETVAPRFAIRQKMNELYSDIYCVIGNSQGQICSADTVDITGMSRVYHTQGDAYRVGEIVVTVTIQYMQDRLNPNLSC